jgi:GntR family transcriptional regulator
MRQSSRENATTAALNKSAVARYLQLATLFRRRIETGEWAIGEQIPTVDKLAKECGVAGMTIRQALDILQQEGLIERFRAKGTFVRARPKRDLWCEVNTDWSGLLLARENATIELLSQDRNVPLPPDDIDVGIRSDAYRHLKRRHSRNGEVFLHSDVYIDEAVCTEIPESEFASKTSMRLVADLKGQTIADARQYVTIGSADLEISDSLDVPLGSPVANVVRIAINQHGRLILVAKGIYRGDMVKIEVKLR